LKVHLGYRFVEQNRVISLTITSALSAEAMWIGEIKGEKIGIISDCTVDSCKSTTTSAAWTGGGGLDVSRNAEAEASNCQFLSCQATNLHGRAITFSSHYAASTFSF
jgi:hypothetical protein